jgi:DNA-binding NarL/FixJ family response regulator
VMVVDDHPVIRQGLARLLAMEEDLAVVAEVASGKQAVAEWPACRPDVGLIDLIMPVMDGVETAKKIQRIDPEARIVMLSSSENGVDAVRAERAGVGGYVTKQCDAREIAAAIREVYAGRTQVRRGRLLGPDREVSKLLTARERDVLMLLRHGLSNVEIGRRLAISDLTVKTHLRGLMTKLGVTDRTAVVARAFDLGLLRVGQP